MIRKNLVFVLVMVMVLSVSGLALAEDLTIQGSTTVFPIAQKAAEVFMQENPDVNISVRGTGSGAGINALVDGATDIANASRFIKDEEVKNAVGNGFYPVPHRVAMDGIAVVVHSSNPVEDLTLEQIKQIYTGKVTNWSEFGGSDKEIVVVSRDTSSGTFGVFKDIALDGAKVTSSAMRQGSNGAVGTVVEGNENAIGYVGLGYVSKYEINAVKVNGVAPSSATVANGTFPIARPLFMFTDGWPEGITAEFINFILSNEGQELAKGQGYVPLH